jgi:hypothetical protein
LEPPKMPIRRPLLLVVFGLIAADPGYAQWQPNGAPVCTALATQSAPQIIGDGLGGAFIAWTDYRNAPDNSSNPDVYVQHLTVTGQVAPGWPINGVAVCTQPSYQFISSLCTDGSGGVFLTWEDYRTAANGIDLYAHHVLANGVLDSRWPVDGLAIAAFPGDQRASRVAPDASGGVFVVWSDGRNGGQGNEDIYLQHVTAAGTPVAAWPVGGLGICIQPGSQGGPQILTDGDGAAFVAWGDTRNTATSSTDIYAVRIDDAGVLQPGWTQNGTVVCAAPGAQGVAGITTDGNGGFFVTWQDFRTAPPSDPFNSDADDIYLQHMNGNGALAAGWPANGFPVCTALHTQQAPDLMADGAGGALLTWEDYRAGVGAIYAQRVTASAAVAPGWAVNGQPISTVAGYQLSPRIAPDELGGAYITFNALTDIYRSYAQHVTGGGTVAPGWTSDGTPLSLLDGGQNNANIAADGLGGAIATWEDFRKPSRIADIYAQELVPSGATATEVSLVSSDAQMDRVTLTWYTSERSAFTANVERRSVTGDWEQIAAVTPDGTGKLTYIDRAITPGGRYGYRLAYAQGSSIAYTAETWVDVPRPVFALRGLTPNPSHGDPVVSFSLPSGEPATVELFDLSGRRVSAREVGSLGIGQHTVQFERVGLPAGIYAVRLRQADKVATARAVVLR